MKISPYVYAIRTIFLSSITASLGLLTLVSPSIANQEYAYRSCAELQKDLNNSNPELTVKGFERVRMRARELDYQKYIVFCNGGIVIDREDGTICRGYIAYFRSRIGGGSNYYADWGKTEGLENDNNTGKERYCRRIK